MALVDPLLLRACNQGQTAQWCVTTHELSAIADCTVAKEIGSLAKAMRGCSVQSCYHLVGCWQSVLSICELLQLAVALLFFPEQRSFVGEVLLSLVLLPLSSIPLSRRQYFCSYKSIFVWLVTTRLG